MGDYASDEARAIVQARHRKEYEEANTEHAKRQQELDFWWTVELNRRSEAAYRRRRPDEIPERGEYSPIARYERETGRR
jgi:hypothetical protein